MNHRRPARPRFAPLLAPALLLCVATVASASAGAAPAAPTKAAVSAPARSRPALEPALYLSWHAPWGMPGASETLDAVCGDTTIVDTLYLTFEPGRTSLDFEAVSGTLYFHAAEGTSLGDYWKFRGAVLTDTPMRVLFEPAPERGFVTPWVSQAAGSPFYDYSTGSGRLRMIYATAQGAGVGVQAGKRAGFARVLLRRPRADESGCAAPMCVEWHSAWLTYGPKDNVSVNRGARWVSINPNGAQVCEGVRAIVGAQPWSPKKK